MLATVEHGQCTNIESEFINSDSPIQKSWKGHKASSCHSNNSTLMKRSEKREGGSHKGRTTKHSLLQYQPKPGRAGWWVIGFKFFWVHDPFDKKIWTCKSINERKSKNKTAKYTTETFSFSFSKVQKPFS